MQAFSGLDEIFMELQFMLLAITDCVLLGEDCNNRGGCTRKRITEAAVDHYIVKTPWLAGVFLTVSNEAECFRTQLSSPSLTH